MFILREMPDPACLTPIPQNEATRRAFYARWGRENCIVFATCRSVEMPPYTQRLSIKLARGGRERYLLGHRTVAVDDDNFLILNDGCTYGSVVECRRDIESFSIFFRPGMAEEALGCLRVPVERSLDRPDWRATRPVQFIEALQPHDRVVSPVLACIRQQLRQGLSDEGWYEEQMHFVLERMLAHHRQVRHHVSRVAVTPHLYLQRKRARVASRLLASTALTVEQVAEEVGFSARSTLFRQLRRWTGINPSALRNQRSVA